MYKLNNLAFSPPRHKRDDGKRTHTSPRRQFHGLHEYSDLPSAARRKSGRSHGQRRDSSASRRQSQPSEFPHHRTMLMRFLRTPQVFIACP